MAILWGSTANYTTEGLSDDASFNRFVSEMSPVTLDFFHGYSGATIPTSVASSSGLTIGQDHGLDVELNVKTDWITNGSISPWLTKLTSIMDDIEAQGPGWVPTVRFVLNHEPENSTADPTVNHALAVTQAGYWRSHVLQLAQHIWARGNPQFLVELTFMGYNAKLRTDGTRFSKWLPFDPNWDPAFSDSERAQVIIGGDIYPRLNAGGDIATIGGDNQAMSSQTRIFDEFYALGYRIFAFSEFAYDSSACTTTKESKVRDAIRGYTDAGIAVAGSLGEWLRSTSYDVRYFSWYESSLDTVYHQLHQGSSHTRMSGYQSLINDMRAVSPPEVDPAPPAPGDVVAGTAGTYWHPVSPMWELATTGSHVVDVRVDAYRDGVLVAADLPIDPDSGVITMDGSAEVRRTCELTVTDPTLVPLLATDPLTPYGTELHIHRGFRYPDGSVERVPVGIFTVDKPSTPLLGPITVTGSDYSKLIADDVFLFPGQSRLGWFTTQEIRDLVLRTIPDAGWLDTSHSPIIGRPVVWEADANPWQVISEMALSIDADFAVRPDGLFWIRPMPQITGTPVWTITIGENGTLLDGTEDWDRERVFNAVVARSEPTDGSNPVQAIAYDTAPGSPTAWGGPFGKRPRSYSSPLLATEAQCLAAANTILARSLIRARTVTVQCVPNPVLDFGDIVTLVLPGRTEDAPPRYENHMVWGYRLPLGLGPMELTLYSTGYHELEWQQFSSSTVVEIPDGGDGTPGDPANSPITVSGISGDANDAVSVSVNITHTFSGDLRLQLIAPDSTVFMLRDQTGGSVDDIVETYTVDATGCPASGVWTLRVEDYYLNDTGQINSWSITILG